MVTDGEDTVLAGQAVAYAAYVWWRRLASQSGSTLIIDDLTELVGRPADTGHPESRPLLDRRSGVTPRYAPMPVVRLGRPQPFHARACMSAGAPWWRRLGRQVVPRRTVRSCCWYHGGDWHKVSETAIRLTGRAQAAGIAHRDIPRYVLQHVGHLSLTGWEMAAVRSLLVDPIMPRGRWPFQTGYINGQHRTQAMLDAGVRRTLVELTRARLP